MAERGMTSKEYTANRTNEIFLITSFSAWLWTRRKILGSKLSKALSRQPCGEIPHRILQKQECTMRRMYYVKQFNIFPLIYYISKSDQF